MLLRFVAGAGLAIHALPALAPIAPPVARGLAIDTRLGPGGTGDSLDGAGRVYLFDDRSQRIQVYQ